MARVITFDPVDLRGLIAFSATKGCDFCATGTPVWRYPARDTGLGTVVYGDTMLRPVSPRWLARLLRVQRADRRRPVAAPRPSNPA